MGGDRETTVPAAAAKKADSPGKTIGRIRIHENAGEVHFHDDAKKIKVAVPVSIWAGKWPMLKTLREKTFIFFDATNNTRLRVTMELKRGRIDARLSVKPTKQGETFAALETFTGV